MFTIYRRVLFYRWWTPVTACEIVPMGILPNSMKCYVRLTEAVCGALQLAHVCQLPPSPRSPSTGTRTAKATSTRRRPS